MIVLDTTIVNVALPSIREDLAFTETSLRLGGERVHAHLWRVSAARPAASATSTGNAGFSARTTLFHPGVAGVRAGGSQGLLVAARAVQGLGAPSSRRSRSPSS